VSVPLSRRQKAGELQSREAVKLASRRQKAGFIYKLQFLKICLKEINSQRYNGYLL
jgi:hypothetical protein